MARARLGEEFADLAIGRGKSRAARCGFAAPAG
jgi:hypothetical protein